MKTEPCDAGGVSSRWTTRRRLRVGVAATRAVLAVLGALGGRAMWRTSRLSADLVDRPSPALIDAMRLEQAPARNGSGSPASPRTTSRNRCARCPASPGSCAGFRRLHTKDACPGTGIGLAMGEKVVEFHGGTITIDPGHQPGTRVGFALPALGDGRVSCEKEPQP